MFGSPAQRLRVPIREILVLHCRGGGGWGCSPRWVFGITTAVVVDVAHECGTGEGLDYCGWFEVQAHDGSFDRRVMICLGS